MIREKVTLIGSGRTDAGVHAMGQTANFHCNTKIPPHAFQKGLNSLLPDDIVIQECRLVPDQFHARFNAIKKRYRYKIRNTPIPAAIGRDYEWWIRTPLNVCAMRSAAALFVGQHDFKAFEGAGSPRAHTTRTVMEATIESKENDQCIIFHIEAEGFLRFMVRNIVGTLVAAGLGKLTTEEIIAIFESKDRNRAPATAPAKGLCLVRVHY